MDDGKEECVIYIPLSLHVSVSRGVMESYICSFKSIEELLELGYVQSLPFHILDIVPRPFSQ